MDVRGGRERSLGEAHLPLRSVVQDELRRMILSGELPPGSRLVEDRLAERLGVSRNPVREAIRVLSAEGFVEVLPRRGAVVASMGQAEVAELFDARMALETLAARLAAPHVTALPAGERAGPRHHPRHDGERGARDRAGHRLAALSRRRATKVRRAWRCTRLPDVVRCKRDA